MGAILHTPSTHPLPVVGVIGLLDQAMSSCPKGSKAAAGVGNRLGCWQMATAQRGKEPRVVVKIPEWMV